MAKSLKYKVVVTHKDGQDQVIARFLDLDDAWAFARTQLDVYSLVRLSTEREGASHATY